MQKWNEARSNYEIRLHDTSRWIDWFRCLLYCNFCANWIEYCVGMETLTIKLRVIEMKATVNWFTVKRLYYKTFYLCIHRHVSVTLKQPIFSRRFITCWRLVSQPETQTKLRKETQKRNAHTNREHCTCEVKKQRDQINKIWFVCGLRVQACLELVL